jgi:hypothetical protein
MLAPDPTFTWGSDRQQYGVDFEDRCTRQRPTAGRARRLLPGMTEIFNSSLPELRSTGGAPGLPTSDRLGYDYSGSAFLCLQLNSAARKSP